MDLNSSGVQQASECPRLARRSISSSSEIYRYFKCRIFFMKVPYAVCLGLIFQAIIASSLSSSTSSSLVPSLQEIKLDPESQVSPRRLLHADVILLDNGSTTPISSLEEYLKRVELKGDEELEPSAKSNKTLVKHSITEVTTTALSHNQNSAAPLQLEREETTSLAPVHREVEAPKPAEIKHHADKHHHGHHEHSPPGNSTGPKPIPQHYQVRSLLNVTQDYPLTHSRLIYGYIWPMMAAITLFTNLMIVFVLTQRDMRTPTNVVLTAIAIADIIPIVVPVPWFIYLFALGNEKQVLYPPIACYFYQHATRSVSEIFYFLSTWLNVLLAVQDYLTACQPHLAKKYCQLRVVVMQTISLTLLAFSLNLPQALKLYFKPVKFYYHGELTWGCKTLQARWFKDLIGDYAPLYDDIFAAIIVIFVDGGPAAALITLTALLIRQLQKQRIQGHLLMEQARTASKRRRERHRQQEYESSARVMIFVLLASLAVKIPFATTYTMMIIQSRFDIHFVENLVDFQTAIAITDLAFVLSYPINFTIFCCCSKKFRHKCIQLLGECNHNTKSTRRRFMSSFSMSLNSSTASQIYERPSISTVASQTMASKSMDGVNQTLEAKESAGQEMWLDQDQGRDSRISSSSFVDDRHPLVLERLCDGYHHLQWLHPGDRRPRFRALLADGSQCDECTARHEDLWASRERRLSDDSAGTWPLPPPPPPMLYMPHHRLPQIVTTRCESIRESSVDEKEAEREQDMEGNHWTGRNNDLSDETYATSGADHFHGEQMRERKHSRQFRETLQEQVDRHELQHADFSEDDEGHLRTHHADERRMDELSIQGSSNPGSGSSFASLKYFKDLLRRRLSGQEDRNSCRGDYSVSETGKDSLKETGMNDMHSSLSLSNSKLTTLPNATGQLADILMSTLLMSGSGDAQCHSVSSEPPSTKSSHRDRSRSKLPRRSHG